jgi:PKD repeat protein
VAYQWEFGDGQTSIEAEPTHTYAAGGSYIARVNFLDAHNHPGIVVQGVYISPTNVPPVSNFSLLSVSGNTVTLRDLSYDPDYNTCGHAGPGKIRISYWNYYEGGLTIEEPINLTDSSSNQEYASTIASSNVYSVTHQVWDNQNALVYTTGRALVRVPADANSINISGRITRSDGTPFPDLRVSITGISVSQYNYPKTDSEGYYHIMGFPPGCYTLAPWYDNNNTYTFTPGSSTICASTTDANFVASP